MLNLHTVEKRSNNNAIIYALKLAHTQNDSNVFAYMLQLIYDIYTYIAKTWLSFCAFTDLRDAANRLIFLIFRSIYTHRNHTQSSDNAWLSVKLVYDIHTYIAKTRLSFCTSTCLQNAVNQSIFCFIRSIYMHRNHIHCKDMTQSLLIYTEWQQRLCAHAATHIHHTHTHTHTAKTRLSFYTSTRSHDAVNRSIFRIIRSNYMHRKHIHCKDTTQSLLIYTERQQRLCTRAATNIQHLHSHCEGTTQLLRTYTSVRRSKSIDFDFLIDLHTLQIHKSKLI